MPTASIPEPSEPEKVLVVDDDELMADLLCEWVKEKWLCEAVQSGADALDVLDETIDIVLLDRQMPGMSGGEVARTIRDTGLTVPILMVSGKQPDFDLLDIPFNDYLVKPVHRPEVQEAIEVQIIRRSFHEQVQKFFAYASRIAVLESAISHNRLAGDERYIELKAKADELRQTVPATVGVPTQPVAQMVDYNADD